MELTSLAMMSWNTRLALHQRPEMTMTGRECYSPLMQQCGLGQSMAEMAVPCCWCCFGGDCGGLALSLHCSAIPASTPGAGDRAPGAARMGRGETGPPWSSVMPQLTSLSTRSKGQNEWGGWRPSPPRLTLETARLTNHTPRHGASPGCHGGWDGSR